jgi:hypothetical protein
VALNGSVEPIGRGRSALTTWRACVLFVALTIGLTWPQAIAPGSVPDNLDSYFNLWRLSWIAHILPLDPRHLFDANIYFPTPHTLAFSDAILLEGLLAAPWIWGGLPVVYVLNLLVFGSFVACGLGAFLLVRELTDDAPAAFVAGMIFAFAPYRFDHYFHLELLWAQWLPLTLWMLHRALASGRWAHGLAVGGLFALQGLSSIYYAVFFAVVLTGFVPVLWSGAPRETRRRAAPALLAGFVLAALVLLPYMLQYQVARAIVGERDEGDIRVYSAGPRHYLATMPDSIVYGGLTGTLGKHEKRLFVSFAAAGLVVLGLWPPFDRRRLAYAAALALAIDGTAGHRGVLFPWLREHVDVFRGLRVPARFGHLVLLGVSVLAGFGLARLRGWLTVARRPLARAAPALVGAIIVVEYMMWPMALIPVQTRPDGVSLWLRSQGPGVVADLPMPTSILAMSSDARAAYRSTFYWRPIVNGYSGFAPTSYFQLWALLARFPDALSLSTLRLRGVSYVIVREAGYGPARYAGIVRALANRCDVAVAGPFPDGASAAMVYTLRPPRAGCGPRP